MSDDRERRVSDLLKNAQPREAAALIEELPEAARSWRLHWDHGWVLYKLGETKLALTALRRAVLMNPHAAETHWGLGVVLDECGDLEGAERHLTRALAIQDSTLARHALALVYMKQRRFAEAEEVHREGVRRKPGSRERALAYADFLSDRGRESEAELMRAKADALE